MPTPNERAQAGLFLALLCNAAGQSFLNVVLPPLGRRLGFSDLQTGLILSVSALLLMLTAAAWGYASERIGRRPVILIALSAATAAPFAFALTVAGNAADALASGLTLMLFFGIRSLQTAISSGLLPAAQAYVADTTTIDKRADGMGVIGAAYGFGAVAGAALAWLVAGTSVPAAFGMLGCAAGAALLCVIRVVPEPGGGARNGRGVQGALRLGRIWPFLAVTLTAMVAYSIVQHVTALRLQDALGFSSEHAIARAGAAFMVTAAMMGVVQAVALRYLAWKPERLLTSGAVLAATALFLCSVARDYVEIVATLALFGAALGFMLPGNLASLSLRAAERAQGKVAGVNVIAQGCGLAIGPVAGASLHQIAHALPFVAAAALMVCCAFFAAVGRMLGRADGPTARAG